MEGDAAGQQAFSLAQEAHATRLNLDLKSLVLPDWSAYQRDGPNRSRIAETLGSQTLASIQAALEME